MTHAYESRLRRVVQYIHDNPAGDLTLDRLADVAALSRFHFHRVFRTMTGETCAEAVRRVRCYRASVWLTQTDDPIADIAARAGYDNTQSFNRAFRAVFGKTPAAFRRTGQLKKLTLTFTLGDQEMPDVIVRNQPEIRLAGLVHHGPYYEIGKTFEQISTVFSSRGLWSNVQGTAAVYYCDVTQTAEEDLRSAAGFAVNDAFDIPDNLQEVRIGGSRCAVLVHEGPYAGLPMAWDSVYRSWLPNSGEMLADTPPFEIYLNSPMDTAPENLRTEICVPVA